jgi:hypothetical protein
MKSTFRDLDGQDPFLFFFFLFFFFFALNYRRRPALNCRRRRIGFFFFFFSFRPKLPSSTDRVFFFFFSLSALNCRRRWTWFFFSFSVRPRLSVTTCSTLHPSDVGFFTSFNREDLAMFTSCSIFKTFVPTCVSTYYLSTCLVVLTFFAFAGHVMDGWMNARLNVALGFKTGWGGSTGCIMHRVPTIDLGG